MAKHSVESGAMNDLVTELRRVTEFVETLISDIQGIAERVSAEWTGEANSQYRVLHAEWEAGARLMSDGAAKVTSRATIAAENYDAVAEHVKGLWT